MRGTTVVKKSKLVAAMILSSVTVFGVHSVAGATSDLEIERDSVQEQREEIQSELSGAEQELAELMNDIADIEQQIDSIADGIRGNEEMMATTNEEIAVNEEKVDELQEEIARLEADIEERFELLKSRASTYQRTGGPTSSYLEVLLGADSFSDFISRALTVTQIARADNEFIDILEANQEKLELAENEFQAILDELDEQMVELEGMQQYMEEQMAEQERLYASVESKRAEQEAMIAALESEEEALAAEEASLMDRIERERERQAEERRRADEERQANAVSNAPSSNSSGASNANFSNNASSGSASTVINVGTRYIGNSSYVFGGGRSQSDIRAGRFDCSGYVSWAFRQIGVSLPTSTDAILHSGQRISASEMRPGDLVFFDTYKRNGHVGIYAGNGQFIGSQSSTGVAFANMTSGYWANNFRGVVVRVLH